MSCYRQRQQIAWRDIKGEAVLLDSREGVVFVLNGVGSRIWSLIEEPKEQAEISRLIAGEYRLAEAAVVQDVSRFLQALKERGLVEVS